MREGVGQALQPFGAGLGVVVLDAAVRLQDLVRAHGGVADEDQLVVARVLADQVPGVDALGVAALVVAPQVVVDAVVEVVELEVLELGPGGREQLLDLLDMVVHAAADIHQQQHLDTVVALGNHAQVEPAGIGGGRSDRAGQVEFELVAVARELAQPAQRQLDVARAERLAVVVVAVGALLPDLDRAAVAALAADPYPLRVVAAMAERAGAAGADPLVAAFVFFLLLLQPFFQRVHQLIPVQLGRVGLLLG